MEKYCLGEDCPNKICEICSAEHKMPLPPTDSFRSHPSISKSGYYSSGGLVWIKNEKTGRLELNYVRRGGD